MQQIQLSDQLYQQVRQRASEAGFQSVDEYVAEIVENDMSIATENCDRLFTHEVVADLHQTLAEMKAGGKTYSSEEVDEYLRQKAQSWLEARGN